MSIPLLNLKAQYRRIKPEMRKALDQAFENAQFILGENVKMFEEEFAKFCGAKYAIGVGSGTDALYLALRACNISRGDEVILPVNTFIATAEAITLNNARPVFVDIDPLTYNIDAGKIERAITKKTKAIIPVHLFGQPADMSPILKLAKKYKLWVVEDCAQAHGARYKGRNVGQLGSIACFSFFPGKNLGAYGDAGMIVTNDKKLEESARMLRNHGREEKYIHKFEGVCSRLDEIQAVVLRIKMKYLSEWNEKRRQKAELYDCLLKDLKEIEIPHILSCVLPVYYVYTIRIKKRNLIQEKLEEKGVSTGIYYPVPLHLQPAYRHLKYKAGDFPEAERAAKEILSLPICPELAGSQIKFIVNSIKEILHEK